MTKPISRKMAVDCLLWRFWDGQDVKVEGLCSFGAILVCAICGKRLYPGEDIQFDHIHAIVHDGPHEYQNLRPVHAECHKAKTKADIQANAKVKRLRGETCTGPKKQIQSRGFDKTKTKGFDGIVRER